MAEDGARMAQDGVKMAQDGAKMAEDGAKLAQDSAKMAQDLSASRFHAAQVTGSGLELTKSAAAGSFRSEFTNSWEGGCGGKPGRRAKGSRGQARGG